MAWWHDLPNELKNQIWGYLLECGSNENCPLAPYASISREWQKIIEPFIFEEVRISLRSQEASASRREISQARQILTKPRQRVLNRLRVRIDYDATKTSKGYRRAFADVLVALFDLLQSWEKADARIGLEIVEIRPCGPPLLTYGVELLRQRTWSIGCVRSLRIVKPQSYISRSTGPELADLILTGLAPGLDTINYEYEIGCRPGYKHKLCLLTEWQNAPAGVKSLTVRESCDQSNLNTQQDWLEYIRTHQGVPEQLYQKSRRLEALCVSFAIDATDFFSHMMDQPASDHPSSPQAVPDWPELRHISLTSHSIWDKAPEMTNKLLLSAARAVRRMPKLKVMEIWNAREQYILSAGCFRYCAAGDGAATLTWESTWPFVIEEATRLAWIDAAKSHSGRGLNFEVRQIPAELPWPFPPAKAHVEAFSYRNTSQPPAGSSTENSLSLDNLGLE
ncbi:hypothetical protein CORC01_06932 [Colletotrichum orchidophilum]|uniref:DUF6546 domain-containing protein n=1 Tax=Colletotrichum orchidophilum TaxID=1209926 RepID=A0A1G4B8I4_9PEZI|nr:uncharacterized protein CORC01_06932 [Colletotrichum orchidophilum]OHE97727.1 hypothetical protein CORC01_06932 [Colletotrichum orchidophilum]